MAPAITKEPPTVTWPVVCSVLKKAEARIKSNEKIMEQYGYLFEDDGVNVDIPSKVTSKKDKKDEDIDADTNVIPETGIDPMLVLEMRLKEEKTYCRTKKSRGNS